MDSLKVTGLSTSLGIVYWTDLLSGVLMCVMFAKNQGNIIYDKPIYK